jgi:hypothetical protein
VRFRVLIDGSRQAMPQIGRCEQGYGRIGQRLHQLIRQTNSIVDRKLEMESVSGRKADIRSGLPMSAIGG